MASWYSMFKYGLGNDRVILPYEKMVGEKVRAEVNKNANSFEEFVWLPKEHESGLFERFHMNQLDYISENGCILVDKILRFENLSDDFENFAREIGFEGKIPHANKSKQRESYQKYYTESTKKEIFQRFKLDFEYFGYHF